MSAQTSEQRTSVYLVRRADALLGALRFFEGSPTDATRRRLQFLAQSDYWAWELDNLVYSFTNLAERQATWASPAATVAKLGQLGLVVDAKRVRRVAWRPGGGGRRPGHWAVQTAGGRVAPVELLREVIDTWNRVVDLAEQQFVKPMRGPAERWNIQARRDLAGLRRTMPALPAEVQD